MSIWTRPLPERISGWWIWGPIALLVTALLLYQHIVVEPRNVAHIQALQALRPQTVHAVRLKGSNYFAESPSKVRQLEPEEIPRFLELISQARPYSPRRPKGVWVCEVEIDVAGRPPFQFMINGTEDTAIRCYLSSRHGTLRNDDLGPFVQAMLRGKRKDPTRPT